MAKRQFPAADRKTFYGKARCTQGTAKPRFGVYHGTQGSDARSGSITLTTRTDGSAHECHDAKQLFVIAPDDAILCGVAGANTGAWHEEDATFANWTRKIWMLNRYTLQFSAHEMAQFLLRNNLRCQFITLEMAQKAGSAANMPEGWTYHAVLSKTTWCPSVHYDPSANAGMGVSLFPHKHFDRWIDFYFANPHIHRPPTRKELRAHKRRP